MFTYDKPLKKFTAAEAVVGAIGATAGGYGGKVYYHYHAGPSIQAEQKVADLHQQADGVLHLEHQIDKKPAHGRAQILARRVLDHHASRDVGHINSQVSQIEYDTQVEAIGPDIQLLTMGYGAAIGGGLAALAALGIRYAANQYHRHQYERGILGQPFEPELQAEDIQALENLVNPRP